MACSSERKAFCYHRCEYACATFHMEGIVNRNYFKSLLVLDQGKYIANAWVHIMYWAR